MSPGSPASASGVAVVSFSNPFFSALALIGNLASLAVMYLLLSAEFVAAAQVLVYAGAVVVMFLFVIAYVGPRNEDAVVRRAELADVRRGRSPQARCSSRSSSRRASQAVAASPSAHQTARSAAVFGTPA